MEFKFPDVGEGITEGKLVAWKVKVGDTVKTDQAVAEVETDKAVVEIPSPASGTVQELKFKEGDTLEVGKVIMILGDGAAPAPQETPATEQKKEEPKEEHQDIKPPVHPTEKKVEDIKEPQAPKVEEKPKQNYEQTRPDYSQVKPNQDFHGEIKATPKVRHLAKEKGIDLSSVKGTGHHGQITEADITNHNPGAAPTPSPQAHEEELPAFDIEEQKSTAQETKEEVKETTHISNEQAAYQHTSVINDPSHVETMTTELLHVRASPSVRQLARELNVDIHNVQPSCASGVLTCEDVHRAAKEDTDKSTDAVIEEPSNTAPQEPKQEVEVQETIQPVQEQSTTQETTTQSGVELSPIRKAIAKKMNQANAIPQVTHVEEVDMTEIYNLRAQQKEVFAEKGIKLTYLPFIIKAVVGALETFPMFNNSYNQEANSAIVNENIHMGIAVDTPHGLMVPVVQDADKKSIVALAKELVDLSTKAKDKKLALNQLSGSTFTITSVGSLGGVFFTPILNYPESGILGIGKIRDVPVIINNQIYAKKMMYISLSFDHRLHDGANAARFANKVKEYLENPQELFMERI